MTVTRNVIYDLLPAYFAGEVSADTRTLVDEFLETDPELRRMADRFRERLQDRTGIDLSDAGSDRERIVFQRAKARFKLRQATLAWAFGAAVGIGMAFLTGLRGPLGLLNPGMIIGLVFGVMAALTWMASTRPDAERWYRLFVDGGMSRPD
jgi:Predicted transmembrane transcriptional regulator (anti-sigma factor)